MEKNFIGVSLPSLVSIAIMVGVIYGLYWGVRKFTSNNAAASA